mgnify:CR=1 FL=1
MNSIRISTPNARDVFVLGQIHVLASILKAIKETPGEDASKIDFHYVLELVRRDLSNPDFEELLVNVSDTLGDLR